MQIFYTKHAKEKFDILGKQSFLITKQQVENTIKNYEYLEKEKFPVLIAQKSLDKEYVLRVVFKEEFRVLKIITFYPARKQKYN